MKVLTCQLFRLLVLICALLQGCCLVVNAQTHSLPQAFYDWIKSPALKHATVTLEVSRDGKSIYSYDADRLMAPASVLKLVTTATALRMLGGDYVLPDSAAIIDTAQVALPGLECYNPDWLIEDIDTDYMPPLQNQLADSGRLLREVVSDTNHESLNLQAETLARMLHPSCSLDSALAVISDYWRDQGLDTECLWMYDGCGLAPSDRVTARFIVQLLNKMKGDPDFVNSLPLVGQEGTLKRFLRDTRLSGRGRLKSGTLKTAVTYAGYLTGTNSKKYELCIMVNNYSGKASDVRRGMEKVLLSLIP